MEHRFFEELSLNQWPALSVMLYDGWILRIAEGYTKRSNSVSPLYGSTLDLTSKVEECEKLYAANGLPPIFKMTPFVCPSHLDEVLMERGYTVVDPTSVQTVRLDTVPEPLAATVRVDEEPTLEWLEAFCRMNRLEGDRRGSMERILANIRTKKGFISFYRDGRIVSCGLGVIERNVIGLYDIVTDPAYRNRGYGEQMILNLLQWGKKQGAISSYLAVVVGNVPAWRLYSKIGYRELYRYWYRVKM